MKSLDDLIKTIAKLRSPKGCPWDKVQTHKTLKRYLIEETYEAIDAIDNKDPEALMEELGDVLLQIILHSQIASENKHFSINDVARNINKKMVNRHPHVFSNVKAKTTREVMKNWEILKKKEKPDQKEIFDGIPNSLPALLKALKVSKKASKEGFEWENKKNLWDTFHKELKEFKQAIKSRNKTKRQEEFGDLLLMIVNLARWYKLDPEDTLNMSIKKFIKRYTQVKKLAKNSLKDLSGKELNKLWEKVKNKGEKNAN